MLFCESARVFIAFYCNESNVLTLELVTTYQSRLSELEISLRKFLCCRKIAMYNSNRYGSARTKVEARWADIEFWTIRGPQTTEPLLLNLFQFAGVTYCISTSGVKLADRCLAIRWLIYARRVAGNREWISACPAKLHLPYINRIYTISWTRFNPSARI